jgi:surface antigen
MRLLFTGVFMKKMISLGILSIGALALMSESAMAYPYYQRYDDPYWHGPRHRRDVVVVEQAPAYYYEEEPAYYEPPPRPVYAPAYAPPQQAYNGGAVRCSYQYDPAGALIGGVAGGAIGSTIGRGGGNVAAIITGALLGGVVGGNATARQYCTQDVFAAPVGRPVAIQNVDAHQNYTITPTREYNEDGRYCREYQAQVNVGGHPRETYGTACQQPDGSWQIVD